MAQRITITAEQRAEIEAARKMNRDKTVDRRLLALLMRSDERSLKEISEATGYHYVHVSSIVSKYVHHGLEAVITPKYGGNHRNLSFEEEAALLEPFRERAEKGQMIEVREIAKAYEKAVGHPIHKTQIYHVLARHNWGKVMPRSKHPKKASNEAVAASKKLRPESKS